MRRPLAALSLLAILLCPARLTAQDATLWPGLVPGSRVRIDAPGILAGRLATTVVSRSGDSVKVRARARRSVLPGEERLDHLMVPLGGITSVEVSRGRSRLLGAAVGAVSIAAVAAALVALDNERPGVCPDAGCPENEKTRRTIEGAKIGGLAGGFLGLLIGRERWRRVDIASRVSFEPGASRGVLALRARF